MRFYSGQNIFFQFGVWSISYSSYNQIINNLITKYQEIKHIAIILKKKLISGGRILFKYYTKIKSYKNKHLHMWI